MKQTLLSLFMLTCFSLLGQVQYSWLQYVTVCLLFHFINYQNL